MSRHYYFCYIVIDFQFFMAQLLLVFYMFEIWIHLFPALMALYQQLYVSYDNSQL